MEKPKAPKNVLDLRERSTEHVKNLQHEITQALEQIEDSGVRFQEDLWKKETMGGGGRTRVLSDGKVFERAGVNFSSVYGDFPEDFAAKLPGEGTAFYATGVSLVIHPLSPMIPTVHMNYRFIQHGEVFWFGGGQDITPYYVFEEDVVHFHQSIKTPLDKFDDALYPQYKKWCDEYFYNSHREEPRGLGGIFFDYVKDADFEPCWKSLGAAFLESYVPIVKKRLAEPYGKNERDFQLHRRGRYVEFNLLHDRGTKFGLQTGGNIESILMSMPPTAKWSYKYGPKPGSREEELFKAYERENWV
jgi:coproporphyrinogen III oxidase